MSAETELAPAAMCPAAFAGTTGSGAANPVSAVCCEPKVRRSAGAVHVEQLGDHVELVVGAHQPERGRGRALRHPAGSTPAGAAVVEAGDGTIRRRGRRRPSVCIDCVHDHVLPVGRRESWPGPR
jgi:hypothetical protein